MDFSSPSWWRDTGERIVRNLVQTSAPVLGAFLLDRTAVTPASVAWSCAAVILFTFLKAALNVTASPGAAWYWVWADRIGSAAAAALIGLLPSNLVEVANWPSLLLAAGGATITSVVMLYLAPPAQRDLDLAE
jgi:hypothetical protein